MVEKESIDFLLPKFSTNPKNGRYTLFSDKNGEKVLVPLSKVAVKTEIRGAIATMNAELEYTNPSKSNPLECTYILPIENNTVLAKFEASIDGRIIETKIQDEESARNKYEDAIASGKAAVFAE